MTVKLFIIVFVMHRLWDFEQLEYQVQRANHCASKMNLGLHWGTCYEFNPI